jgi:hypothetical protein
VIVVVDVAVVTECPSVPLLPACSESPLYVAVIVFGPTAVDVRLQEPVPVPDSVMSGEHEFVPSLTVTVPDGVPNADVTDTLTVYGWPMADGSGPSPVIVVVVDAVVTVWLAVPLLPACSESPLYVAVIVFGAPVVVDVRLHEPVPPPDNVMSGEHELVPSLTVTVPDGVPNADVTDTATL